MDPCGPLSSDLLQSRTSQEVLELCLTTCRATWAARRFERHQDTLQPRIETAEQDLKQSTAYRFISDPGAVILEALRPQKYRNRIETNLSTRLDRGSCTVPPTGRQNPLLRLFGACPRGRRPSNLVRGLRAGDRERSVPPPDLTPRRVLLLRSARPACR